MISAFLMGGLGNQMFQIAAAYSLALENNDEAVFDFEACYTPLQGHKSSRYKNNIFKNIATKNNLELKYLYLERNHAFNKIPYSKNLLIKGYFQSEKYFEANKEKITNLFHIDENQKNKIISKYKLTKGKFVSVHIRRGDFLKNPNIHPTCSLNYYKKAIEFFEGYKFIFVSDDIEWVKQNFINESYIYSSENDEIDDFILLSLCDNHIIANSTFSWWAAYLNKKQNKKIICPEKFFGTDGPKDQQDIYPNDWIKI